MIYVLSASSAKFAERNESTRFNKTRIVTSNIEVIIQNFLIYHQVWNANILQIV